MYGQSFPLHTVCAQNIHMQVPLMSFFKFILTCELKTKWNLIAFNIIVLLLPSQFLLHIGLIRFTSFLKQWFTFFPANWNLFISKQCIKHVLCQADAALLLPVSVIHNVITKNKQSPNILYLQEIKASDLKRHNSGEQKGNRWLMPSCCNQWDYSHSG